MVTGNNKYFTLTGQQVAEIGLRESEFIRVSPPGSRHLKGLKFTNPAWEELVADGARCYLFYPRRNSLSKAAQRYVRSGETLGVHEAYKCRVREPWWRVPLVSVSDLLLSYMAHDRIRLTSNNARVRHLNSVYGVGLRRGRQTIGRELLPLACLNSLTLLGGEMVGRAYGGGLLKVEPNEADLLPVPSVDLLKDAKKDLKAVEPQLATALRQGNLKEAAKLVDRVLLSRHLGISQAQLTDLRRARKVLFTRRVSRGRSSSGKD